MSEKLGIGVDDFRRVARSRKRNSPRSKWFLIRLFTIGSKHNICHVFCDVPVFFILKREAYKDII